MTKIDWRALISRGTRPPKTCAAARRLGIGFFRRGGKFAAAFTSFWGAEDWELHRACGPCDWFNTAAQALADLYEQTWRYNKRGFDRWGGKRDTRCSGCGGVLYGFHIPEGAVAVCPDCGPFGEPLSVGGMSPL